VWVAAVVVAAAVVEGEALVVTSTLGMVVAGGGDDFSPPDPADAVSQSITRDSETCFASQHLCACVRCRYCNIGLIS
jgi:hypothetical protein